MGFMRTLLKNMTILPMSGEDRIILGDIGIEDGKIAFTGNDESFKADVVEDMTGRIALPAFINTHTHLPMTLMRNYKDTAANLMDWLGEIFPIEDKLNEKDIYYGSLTGLCELIKGGCTTFADMYFQQWMSVRAVKEAGINACIGQTFFGGLEDTKNRIKENYPKIMEAIGNSDRFRVDAAIHAIYTCTGETYSYASSWAKDIGGMVNTHLSETKGEMDNCLKEHGMLPAEYLDTLKVFDTPTYIAHGVWLQDSELRVLKDKGISIAHNPASNCKLASGIAPISHFRKMGVNVSLGTDGASSNNSLCMIKDINLAAMISTISTMDTVASTPYEILEMATINGAKALKLDDRLGSLERGKDADITIIDGRSANLSPLNDVFSAIVFAADKSNIERVYSRGVKLLEKGKLLTLDEEEIIKGVNECWKELLER